MAHHDFLPKDTLIIYHKTSLNAIVEQQGFKKNTLTTKNAEAPWLEALCRNKVQVSMSFKFEYTIVK
jgi:hypothetical protein